MKKDENNYEHVNNINLYTNDNILNEFLKTNISLEGVIENKIFNDKL